MGKKYFSVTIAQMLLLKDRRNFYNLERRQTCIENFFLLQAT